MLYLKKVLEEFSHKLSHYTIFQGVVGKMAGLRSSLKFSREEEAELHRSTKKAKETHQVRVYSEARLLGSNTFTPLGSHKRKLILKINF